MLVQDHREQFHPIKLLLIFFRIRLHKENDGASPLTQSTEISAYYNRKEFPDSLNFATYCIIKIKRNNILTIIKFLPAEIG
jgi:hypothetical protein